MEQEDLDEEAIRLARKVSEVTVRMADTIDVMANTMKDMSTIISGMIVCIQSLKDAVESRVMESSEERILQ